RPRRRRSAGPTAGTSGRRAGRSARRTRPRPARPPATAAAAAAASCSCSTPRLTCVSRWLSPLAVPCLSFRALDRGAKRQARGREKPPALLGFAPAAPTRECDPIPFPVMSALSRADPLLFSSPCHLTTRSREHVPHIVRAALPRIARGAGRAGQQ